MLGDIVRISLDLIACICDCDRKAAIPHDGQVNDIVPYKSGFCSGDAFLLQNLLERGQLVLNALIDIFQFQVARPQCDSFRNAFRDQPGLETRVPHKRNCSAVVGMEPLGLNK